MATDTDKLTAVNTTTTTAYASSVQENPKNTVDPTDHVQNPPAARSSTTNVSSKTVGLKKDGEDSKNTVAVVPPLSGDAAPVSDAQKKIRRAERFGMAVQLSEQEKRNSRAERFGTATKTNASDASKSSEDLKRRARAERFGLTVPASPGDEAAKKKARLARFAPYSKPDSVEEDKRKARAQRFSGTTSSSLSPVNGERNIEPKAAIAGKAGGVA